MIVFNSNFVELLWFFHVRMNDTFDYNSVEDDNDEEGEEEVESEDLNFIALYRRMKLDTDDEEDIFVRYLIARIENYYESLVLRNLVHTAPYISHQIIRNMLNSHFKNYFDHCRDMADFF